MLQEVKAERAAKERETLCKQLLQAGEWGERGERERDRRGEQAPGKSLQAIW